MSAAHATFSPFSPSYENIANRMNRLKQNRSASNLSQIRPNSSRKIDINVFAIDPRESSLYQPRRRLSPANVFIGDQANTVTDNKYTGSTGKVARNTGIKKLNQTHLRDIKNTVNLKTQGNSSRAHFTPYLNQNLGIYNIKSSKDEIKMTEQPYKAYPKASKNFIPGRIYSRQVLNTMLV